MATFRRSLLLLGAAFAFVLPSLADAGRRPYINLWDTETLKKGEVELEEWLWWKQDSNESAGWLWFAPVFGLSENVELAFPWEAVSNRDHTAITDFTAEARIRLGDAQNDASLFHEMVRLFYQQNLNHPYNGGRFGIPWFGGNLVSSLGQVAGSHATLDVGAYSDFRFKTAESLSIHTLGAGYTYSVSKEARIGAEYSHEIGLSQAVSANIKYFYLGPDFAFSRGNVWITLGMLKGLTVDTPSFLSRFMFAVAL